MHIAADLSVNATKDIATLSAQLELVQQNALAVGNIVNVIGRIAKPTNMLVGEI